MKLSNSILGLFSFAVAITLFSIQAVAQPPQEDDQEVSVAATFFRPIGSGGGNFAMDGRYGYFMSDEWQVGLRQSYTLNFNDDFSDTWNAVTAPYAIYHFNMRESGGVWNNLVPYLGGFVGAVWNDEDFTGTVGPQGGLKYYVADNTFFNLEYRYEWFFEELGDANEVQDANHVAVLGIGYNW